MNELCQQNKNYSFTIANLTSLPNFFSSALFLEACVAKAARNHIQTNYENYVHDNLLDERKSLSCALALFL